MKTYYVIEKYFRSAVRKYDPSEGNGNQRFHSLRQIYLIHGDAEYKINIKGLAVRFQLPDCRGDILSS